MGGICLKISSIEVLNSNSDGLSKSEKIPLGNIVVLSGKNGSGKTRLLKLLTKYITNLSQGTDTHELCLYVENNNEEKILSSDDAKEITLVDYSHYDAQLQSARDYSPYVISKAKELLRGYDYSVTALNALLLLEDMAHEYSDEFKGGEAFNTIAKNLSDYGITLTKDLDSNIPKLFAFETDEAFLSPGQQYLLRIAVACYCNEHSDKVLFILDEPELHLHPAAQIKMIERIRERFPEAQIWISTHSLSLISNLKAFDESTSLLFMSNGTLKKMRSDVSSLLKDLAGNENDNIVYIRQLFDLIEEYACNRFAIECMYEPGVSDAKLTNPETAFYADLFLNDNIIIDYGAGKCRMLEEIEPIVTREKISQCNYVAYEPSEIFRERALDVLSSYDLKADSYFNSRDELLSKINGKADYVLLVNVLHEIHPEIWKDEFSAIKTMLKPDGTLIIVERTELSNGEKPYSEGYLMLNQSGADKLFGEGNYLFKTHQDNPLIGAYIVKADKIYVSDEMVSKSVDAIGKEAFEKIKEIKETEYSSDRQRFKAGLSLAFQLNQFANAKILAERML